MLKFFPYSTITQPIVGLFWLIAFDIQQCKMKLQFCWHKPAIKFHLHQVYVSLSLDRCLNWVPWHSQEPVLLLNSKSTAAEINKFISSDLCEAQNIGLENLKDIFARVWVMNQSPFFHLSWDRQKLFVDFTPFERFVTGGHKTSRD